MRLRRKIERNPDKPEVPQDGSQRRLRLRARGRAASYPQPVPDAGAAAPAPKLCAADAGARPAGEAAVIYVLALQFEIVALGPQRQIAMSTERRVTRLDAVLAPLRDNLLRLRGRGCLAGARRPGGPPRCSPMRRHRLSTVHACPAARQRAAGAAGRSAITSSARRGAAVEQAALFAQQARLVTGGRGASAAPTIYVEGAQLWVYPWVRSDELARRLGAAGSAGPC